MWITVQLYSHRKLGLADGDKREHGDYQTNSKQDPRKLQKHLSHLVGHLVSFSVCEEILILQQTTRLPMKTRESIQRPSAFSERFLLVTLPL